MKRGITIAWLCLLGLAMLLSGCRIGSGLVIVTDADDGEARVLKVGDRITVRLEGNPTTGHAWVRVHPTHLVGGPLDVIEEGSCSAQDQCSSVGSGGDFLFEYRAASAGTITLTYTYKRPWEEDPMDEFTIVLWVQ